MTIGMAAGLLHSLPTPTELDTTTTSTLETSVLANALGLSTSTKDTQTLPSTHSTPRPKSSILSRLRRSTISQYQQYPATQVPAPMSVAEHLALAQSEPYPSGSPLTNLPIKTKGKQRAFEGIRFSGPSIVGPELSRQAARGDSTGSIETDESLGEGGGRVVTFDVPTVFLIPPEHEGDPVTLHPTPRRLAIPPRIPLHELNTATNQSTQPQPLFTISSPLNPSYSAQGHANPPPNTRQASSAPRPQSLSMSSTTATGGGSTWGGMSAGFQAPAPVFRRGRGVQGVVMPKKRSEVVADQRGRRTSRFEGQPQIGYGGNDDVERTYERRGESIEMERAGGSMGFEEGFVPSDSIPSISESEPQTVSEVESIPPIRPLTPHRHRHPSLPPTEEPTIRTISRPSTEKPASGISRPVAPESHSAPHKQLPISGGRNSEPSTASIQPEVSENAMEPTSRKSSSVMDPRPPLPRQKPVIKKQRSLKQLLFNMDHKSTTPVPPLPPLPTSAIEIKHPSTTDGHTLSKSKAKSTFLARARSKPSLKIEIKSFASSHTPHSEDTSGPLTPALETASSAQSSAYPQTPEEDLKSARSAKSRSQSASRSKGSASAEGVTGSLTKRFSLSNIKRKSIAGMSDFFGTWNKDEVSGGATPPIPAVPAQYRSTREKVLKEGRVSIIPMGRGNTAPIDRKISPDLPRRAESLDTNVIPKITSFAKPLNAAAPTETTQPYAHHLKRRGSNSSLSSIDSNTSLESVPFTNQDDNATPPQARQFPHFSPLKTSPSPSPDQSGYNSGKEVDDLSELAGVTVVTLASTTAIQSLTGSGSNVSLRDILANGPERGVIVNGVGNRKSVQALILGPMLALQSPPREGGEGSILGQTIVESPLDTEPRRWQSGESHRDEPTSSRSESSLDSLSLSETTSEERDPITPHDDGVIQLESSASDKSLPLLPSLDSGLQLETVLPSDTADSDESALPVEVEKAEPKRRFVAPEALFHRKSSQKSKSSPTSASGRASFDIIPRPQLDFELGKFERPYSTLDAPTQLSSLHFETLSLDMEFERIALETA